MSQMSINQASKGEHESDRVSPPWTPEWHQLQVTQLAESVCDQLGYYPISDSLMISVIIPVFNEQSTLLELVNNVAEVPIRKEIILIDDGSTDSSPDIIVSLTEILKEDARTSIRYQLKRLNEGKGAALVSGFKLATGDIIIIQDADLEYDPREYPKLIRPVVQGEADVVYGSRFLGNHPDRVLHFWHSVANRLLTAFSNCFTKLNLTDMESCYKVMRREVVETLIPVLREKRFGIEPEITAKIARRKYNVRELPISYAGRTYGEGKKIGWLDGVYALWCIVRYGLAD